MLKGADGKPVRCGGMKAGSQRTAECWKYYPENLSLERWALQGFSLSMERVYGAAVAISGGRTWIIGGSKGVRDHTTGFFFLLVVGTTCSICNIKFCCMTGQNLQAIFLQNS